MPNTSPISSLLSPYPRAGLTVEPTPLYKLSRLSAHLGHHIFVLREDLTGFALGGNKVRKLDYLIADAISKKADVLITTGASSFSRNAAAAGKAFGLDLHIVITGEEHEHNAASRALFAQFGASLHYTPAGESAAEYDRLLNLFKSEGKAVYELHPGGSDEIGALGYLRVFDQIMQYTATTGIHFNRIILPTGSTGTQVGLMLGGSITACDTRIIGMAVSQPAAIQRERVRELAQSTAAMLAIRFDESTLHIDDRFLGAGYAIPSADGQRAVQFFAETEGLLLDQVYGGKAAAGLIHCAQHNEFDEDDNTLFIHTGGNAGLFY